MKNKPAQNKKRKKWKRPGISEVNISQKKLLESLGVGVVAGCTISGCNT